MRKLPIWVMIATSLLAGEAHAQSLIDIFEQVLSAAIHSAIPDAIAPLVTAAENADTIAIAALEIAAGRRDRQIKLEYASANSSRQHELDRMEKANEEIKGVLTHIKGKRCAEEKKAKDDGWDPFHARMSAGGPVVLPGVYLFHSLDDGSTDLPGDVPTGPICALVTPGYAGYETPIVHVSACSMQVAFQPTVQPDRFDVQVQLFGMLLDSFLIGGSPTGPNQGALNQFGSPPHGEYDAISKQFEIRFEGTLRNGLFPPGTAPILFFATAFGGLDASRGVALVGADDPMIVPMPPGLSPLGQPKIMGAHIIDYDAGSRTLRFLENTSLLPNADVAMVRNGLGNYIADPATDPAIRATVIIDPLHYSGPNSLGMHEFGSAPIRVMLGGTAILLGTLANVELDPNCGDLFGDLQIGFTNPVSPVLGEIGAAPGPKSMQLCSTPGGFDLLSLTNGFTASGRMPWPEIFHAGVLPAAVSDAVLDVRRPSLRVLASSQRGPVRIVYTIASAATPVCLDVYDVSGRLVRTLEHAVRDSGEYVRTWDRLGAEGTRVGRGVYVVRLQAGAMQLAQKVVVARE